jgi:uncharacterized protein
VRVLWILFGFFALALGSLGVVLPLLPTVPFFILAAFCFSKSSAQLHNWLLSHPTFGPIITDWQTNGAISKWSKTLATVSIIAVFFLSLILGAKPSILAIQFIVLGCVLTFIWSRPNP